MHTEVRGRWLYEDVISIKFICEYKFESKKSKYGSKFKL